jgi:hypothetical protein
MEEYYVENILIELLMLSLFEDIIKCMSYCYFWVNFYFNFNGYEKSKDLS